MLISAKYLNYTEQQAADYEIRFNKTVSDIADFLEDYLKRSQTDASLANHEEFDKQAYQAIKTSFSKHLTMEEVLALCCDAYVGHARKGLVMLGMKTLANVFEQMVSGKPCTCARCTGNLNSEQQTHQE